MKKWTLLALAFGGTLTASAQTWEEWFEQKETGKKYLVEQIAALKVYGDYARKGYAIAGKGWRVIQGIKEEDLKGHSEFLGSLSVINPRIKASPLVAGIITLQAQTVRKIKEVRHRLSTLRKLTDPETKFSNKVLDALLKDCAEGLEELLLLTTSDELTLSDDERLQRLERLYAQMQELYGAASSLGTDVRLLSMRRGRLQAETDHSKNTHGLR